MKQSRAGPIAFVASGLSVVVSIPASMALRAPDLPGLVLIASGGVALLLARRQWRGLEFAILATLVVLIAVLLVLHLLWHRLGVSHEWLELLYPGAVVGYCAMALYQGRRLLTRDTGRPSP